MVSVFVDTVEDAIAAVAAGASDLLLRDWDTESIGALRDALADHDLVERVAVPPSASLSTRPAQHFDPGLFKAYLDLVDASGCARPRYEWAPGKDLTAPVPARRFSAEWT